MSEVPDRTIVLVIGAGPVGLATAISFHHNGLRDFVIVDALPQGKNLSRCMVLHAAGLEALDTISCGDDIVSQGIKSTSWHFHTRSTRLFSLPLDIFKSHTRHSYALAISQNVVERTLEKKMADLGITIHRPLKVVGMTRNAGNSELTDVTFEGGRVITTKYVVAADGVRSSIRAMLGIDYVDPTLAKGEVKVPTQMMFADVTFENAQVDHFRPTNTLSQCGMFVVFPLPSSFNECLAVNGQANISERIYRIGCGVPLAEGEIPRQPSKEYIQDLIDRFGPYCLSSDSAVNPSSKPTYIKRLIWSSRVLNRSFLADTTFVRMGCKGQSGEGGAVFLIGDAAHSHSPAGGQGLTLGFNDAISIGKALVKHHHAAETQPLSEADLILRQYEMARRAHALSVIKFVEGVANSQAVNCRERMYWWLPVDYEMLLDGLFWVMGHLPFIQRRIAWELSGLGALM